MYMYVCTCAGSSLSHTQTRCTLSISNEDSQRRPGKLWSLFPPLPLTTLPFSLLPPSPPPPSSSPNLPSPSLPYPFPHFLSPSPSPPPSPFLLLACSIAFKTIHFPSVSLFSSLSPSHALSSRQGHHAVGLPGSAVARWEEYFDEKVISGIGRLDTPFVSVGIYLRGLIDGDFFALPPRVGFHLFHLPIPGFVAGESRT